jgi:hypothetical protein
MKSRFQKKFPKTEHDPLNLSRCELASRSKPGRDVADHPFSTAERVRYLFEG